jgi:hypothetical protein
MKTITPADFIKMKFSDAIELVIEDINSLPARGIELDMSLFVTYNGPERMVCTVCAGGAAALGFYSQKQIEKLWKADQEGRETGNLELYLEGEVNISQEKWDNMQITFDLLRRGHLYEACVKWYVICSQQMTLQTIRKFKNRMKNIDTSYLRGTPSINETTGWFQHYANKLRELGL